MVETVPAFHVDVVIVSPMTRTLETACGIFGNPKAKNGEPILMHGQETIDVRLAPFFVTNPSLGCPNTKGKDFGKKLPSNRCH